MAGFFREFLGQKMHVGALAPSGRFLAKRIVHEARVPEARNILELGSGTGAFTGRILSEKKTNARFLAIERNEAFGETLRSKFPNLDLALNDAQAVDLDAWLGGTDGFDSVVSGLPWAAFPDELQRSILDHVRPRITNDGVFTTFAYFGPHKLEKGRRFRALLESRFQKVRVSPVVLMNFPPAFVYVAEGK